MIIVTLGVMLVGAVLMGRNLLRRGRRPRRLYALGALLFAVGFYGSMLAYVGVIK